MFRLTSSGELPSKLLSFSTIVSGHTLQIATSADNSQMLM